MTDDEIREKCRCGLSRRAPVHGNPFGSGHTFDPAPRCKHRWEGCATCADSEGCWICLDCGAEGKGDDYDDIREETP